ncbi:GNAT family N-acetyltransferase [Kitasatospora kifunensis]|uniref:RimJ/RimL family protein N-acetyltransferase n=1 Tax=Kitasatospora kifunensis TaxID=58351 RepID=A0A7W7VV69_KITKI|nr:GNAT family protein [Kitasatospora kifunensis]MBB4924091.1 RimJ/RimL family protein N-acetyltransferase [Kitasatospora kifunensis]
MVDTPRADFTLKPTLTGSWVRLRPFEPADVAALAPAFEDRELLRLTGSANRSDAPLRPQTPEQAEQFRQWRNAQPDRLDLAIVDLAGEACVGEACVGEVVLNQWDAANRSCNFRILLSASGRNRGLGTEATRLVLAHGFEQLGLHRIALEVYAFNPRARRVYEKVGFIAEGTLRDALHYDGQWIDATVMSILAPDWARHRGRP